MKDQQYIPVRLSHLLRHASVGSIVRSPDYLMTVKDIRYWTNRNGQVAGRTIWYVDQVKSALGIEQELREPPIAREVDKNGKKIIDGTCIPTQIFPSWMGCVACGLLHYKPWRNNNETGLSCQRCKKSLQQLPWVLVHNEGHMGDVPWHMLAHNDPERDEQKQCRFTWNEPYLKLTDHNGEKIICCSRCNSENSFPPRKETIYFRSKMQPWLQTKAAHSGHWADILEINDTRVHSPVTKSALVIPPESRVRRGSVVDRLYSSSEKRNKLLKAKTSLEKKSAVKTLATELQCRVEDINAAWNEIGQGYPLYEQQITTGLLLESEYLALTDNIPDLSDDEDFVPHHLTEEWLLHTQGLASETLASRIGKLVDQVVSVARLKEILVLTGFRRMGDEGKLVSPAIEEESSWLPALELYGEGIFITLDENILNKWEQHEKVIDRTRPFVNRYVAADLKHDPEVTVTSRFMLLHALAHKIIKELESQAGYPAASLKERIYSSTKKQQPMAGILIYVAIPDVVGSLGGLAELANPKRLLPLLSRVFESANWCSLDPVCTEHEGQGPCLLNRAACHACQLVPETSCLYGNVLLDRVFIKGDSQNGMPSVLEYII